MLYGAKKKPWGTPWEFVSTFRNNIVHGTLRTIWNLGNKHGKLFTISQPTHPPNHPSLPRPPGPTLSWSCFRQLYLKKNKILGLIQLILIDALIEITFLRVLFLSKKILLFLAKWTGGTDEMGGGEGMMMHFGYGYPPFPSLGYLLWANYSPSGTQWTHRTRVVELI